MSFRDVTGIVADVQRLRSGYTPVGRWTLAQTCRHLADSFTLSMDGFDTCKHRVMRWVFGRRALRNVFASGIMPGLTVTESLDPPADADLDASMRRLTQAIERYRAHTARLHVHPFFGRLSRAEWDRLHCIHAAHHLSLLVPAEPPSRSS